MQLHLDEISSNVAKGAHAVVLLDRAGWHITSKLDMPENITPIFLPSRTPEFRSYLGYRDFVHTDIPAFVIGVISLSNESPLFHLGARPNGQCVTAEGTPQSSVSASMA